MQTIPTDWRAWLATRSEELPLVEALHLIAVDEGSTAPLFAIEAQLSDLAEGLPRDLETVDAIEALCHRLFVEHGFCGDDTDYDNPQNSRIDRVLARGKGLPILLSAITIEVARQIGLPLVGVSFPGHFLVSTAHEPRIFLDPFYGGRTPTASELAERLASRDFPASEEALQQALAPTSSRDIVLRASTNLMGSWLRRNNLARALTSAERRVALRPDIPEMQRDRGWILAKLGRVQTAAIDLTAYLSSRPHAPDRSRVEQLLSSLQIASS